MNPLLLDALSRRHAAVEDQAREEWSRKREHSARSARVAQQLGQAAAAMKSPSENPLRGVELSMRRAFGERLQAAADEASLRQKQAEQAEGLGQQRFQAARKESLAVQRLRERQQARLQAAELKEEQRQLDDFVSARHGR